MARIAVGGFHHDTNTFAPGMTDFAHFTVQRDRPPLIRGKELFAWMPTPDYPLSALLHVLARQHEFVPLVWASGGVGALVSADAFERIADEMIGRRSRALPVDAVKPGEEDHPPFVHLGRHHSTIRELEVERGLNQPRLRHAARRCAGVWRWCSSSSTCSRI
jgi:hypothetical protein